MLNSSRGRLLAFAGLLVCSQIVQGQTMELIAGQGRFVDAPGTTVGLTPGAIAAAPDGYLYASDINGKLMRLDMSLGTVTALPATSAGLSHNLGYTYGLAVDFSGAPHVYSQGALHRIEPDGTLTNVGAAYSGPMAFAPDGNLYIVPGDNRVYIRHASGAIEVFAGGDDAGFGGDDGPASAAVLSGPQGIAVAGNGDIYVSDSGNNRIRRIAAVTGVITTFAGNGASGAPINGVPALQSPIAYPYGLTFDAAGNLLVGSGQRILRIEAVSGLVTILGGNGSTVMSGDGGPALSAGISWPRFIAVDAAGDVFFSDSGLGHAIRKITASTGIVTKVLGNELSIYCGAENAPARESCLTQPVGLDTDAAGNLTIVDVSAQRLRRISAATGRMSTFKQMAEAPIGLEHDAAGNLYTASYGRYQVNRIDAVTGAITVVAGGRGYGFGGDGGPATLAFLAAPTDVALDAAVNIFIADGGNGRVRRVDATSGIISTIAFGDANALEIDPAGNLFFNSSCTLRKIDAVTRIVSTIAGTGTCRSSDTPGGTLATTTNIGTLPAFALEPDGNIVLAWYQQIYRLNASTGILSRVAAPGGVFTTAEGVNLRYPKRMEFDPAGNLYISQDGFPYNYVFKVTGLRDSTPPQIVATVTGTAGAGGWYRSDVNVSWNVSDAESMVSSTSGCSATSVTADTAGVTFTCSATSLGGTATRSVTIQRDTVAPTLTFGAGAPAADASGWNSTSITVPFTATDSLSGVYLTSGASPLSITQEGAGVTQTVTVTDFAGNVASFTTTGFNLDLTAPVITPNQSGTYGADGWYRSDVSVSFTVDEPTSPFTSSGCEARTVNSDTSGVTFTCSATSAGGTATASITLKRDATAPALAFGAAAPAPDGAGWNTTDVSIPFTTSDLTSGVATTSTGSPVAIGGNGAGLSSPVTVTDKAGNSATFATPVVNIDRSPPSVQPIVSGTSGLNGWFTSDVQVGWAINESPANIISSNGCANSSVTVDTAGVTFTCSVISGGGSASSSVTIKRDATAPVLTFGAFSPVPNANGWNKTNVTVPFTRSDALSGLATTSATSPLTFSIEGANQTKQVVVADLAGNTATFTTAPRNIDKTAPYAEMETPGDNATYAFYADVAADFVCADLSLASCTAPVALGEFINTTSAGSKTFKVTAKDLAGFTTTHTHTYNVTGGFDFDGFLAPIRAPNTLNVVTAGSLVPLRWRLPTGSGGFVSNPASFVSATVSTFTCSGGSVTLNDTATGAAGLNYDAASGTFAYNWATTAGSTGCRKLVIKLKDNSTHELRFRFQ